MLVVGPAVRLSLVYLGVFAHGVYLIGNVARRDSHGVTWVHGDECTESEVERDHLFCELEFWEFSSNSTLNCKHLLCNDRQYFEIKTVELVEATPGSRGGEALEELGHDKVTKTDRSLSDSE